MSAHITVLDDDPDLSTVLCALLTDAGYQALPILIPATALDLLRTTRPDLILQDLHYGGTNAGIALLRTLSQDSVLASVPVIVCTADLFALRRYRDEIAQQGYTVVTKPFDIDDMLVAVEAALGKGATGPQ